MHARGRGESSHLAWRVREGGLRGPNAPSPVLEEANQEATRLELLKRDRAAPVAVHQVKGVLRVGLGSELQTRDGQKGQTQRGRQGPWLGGQKQREARARWAV